MTTMTITCELSTPPSQKGDPLSPTSPGARIPHSAKNARKGASGWLADDDPANIFAFRRRTVHSTSYADLLSPTWKPATWKVPSPYAQKLLAESKSLGFIPNRGFSRQVTPEFSRQVTPEGGTPLPTSPKLGHNPSSPKQSTIPKGQPMRAPRSNGANDASPSRARSAMAKSMSEPMLSPTSPGMSAAFPESSKINLRGFSRQVTPEGGSPPPSLGCDASKGNVHLPPLGPQNSAPPLRPQLTVKTDQASLHRYDPISPSQTTKSWTSPTMTGLRDCTPNALTPTKHKRASTAPRGKPKAKVSPKAKVTPAPQPVPLEEFWRSRRPSKGAAPAAKTDPSCFSTTDTDASNSPPSRQVSGGSQIELLFNSVDAGPRPQTSPKEQSSRRPSKGVIGAEPASPVSPVSPPTCPRTKSKGCAGAPRAELATSQTVKGDTSSPKESTNETRCTRASPLAKTALVAAINLAVEEKKEPVAKAPALWKKATAAVKRSLKVQKLIVVEGAPTHRESLERLQMGFMSDSESKRVHQAFNRFSHGEEDLDRSVLDHVILHLGYVLEDEEIVETMADRISDLSGFDLKELFSFLDEFATAQNDVLTSVFNKWATVRPTGNPDGTKTVSVENVHRVMKDLQIFIMSDVFEELLQRAGLSETPRLHYDFDGMSKIVAAYNVCEGFTSKDLEKAKEVFKKAESESDNGALSVTDLPNALLDFFGVHCIKYLRELVETVGEALSKSTVYTGAVTFHEFLVWARRLRNAELFQLVESFDNADGNDDGMISFDELMTFLKQEGFSLSSIEINEFLVKAKLKQRKSYSFEDAAACLMVCRKSEGFSAEDYEERIAAFNKFDDEEEGELTTLQVLDLLRYLGYQVQVEDVERYAAEVDFNLNGTMDPDEYLRLMRLHVEDELETVHKVFHMKSSKNGLLPVDRLHEALRESGSCPTHCDVYAELCQECLDPSLVELSFDQFKVLCDQSHVHVKKAQRKKANFSDDEFALLQNTFKWYDLKGNGLVDHKQLSNLLFSSGLALHTSEHRKDALEMLDKARQSCLDAEIPDEDVGQFGVFSASFWVMMHAWRIIARENESKRIERLDAAREATNFSLSEVAEFQEIFTDRVKKAGASDPEEGLSSEGRRRSMPELTKASPQLPLQTGAVKQEALTLEGVLSIKNANEQLPFVCLKKLLGHLQLKLSANNAKALQVQFEDITGSCANNDDGSEGTIDLAGFLYLMRWMLDSNFANINGKSASAAKTAVSKEPSVEKQTSEKVIAPVATTKPSGKFCRRASI